MGLLSLEKRKLTRDLGVLLKCLLGGYREDDTRFFLRQWTQAATKEILMRCKENTLYYEVSQTLEQIFLIGCIISILRDTQNSSRQVPQQPDVTNLRSSLVPYPAESRVNSRGKGPLSCLDCDSGWNSSRETCFLEVSVECKSL